MIHLKKCRIKNWDQSEISPLQMIKDRILIDENHLNFVNQALLDKTINKRFHDEPKRIVNNLIRWCQGSMGMYAGTKTGCLYKEVSSENKNETVVEHTVPVSDLLEIYFNKKNLSIHSSDHFSIGLFLFFPVCLLSKKSNILLNNFSKKNDDLIFPFKRYKQAGIPESIQTHTGENVLFDNWTIYDHFKLVEETVNSESNHHSKEFAEIFEYFDIENEIRKFLNLYLKNPVVSP